jgi:hypothetical protein
MDAPWTTKAQPRQTMTRSNARASPRGSRAEAEAARDAAAQDYRTEDAAVDLDAVENDV